MGPTGNALRVLQLHVSRRCNLACLHCYSTSGPQHRDELPPDLWRSVIDDAAAQGYNVVGFSGGEPLMFKPLRELLLQARGLGLRTTVTSNGMLLDERRLQLLQGAADLLAISLDGKPESHDRMRGHPRAFATMARRLPALREVGIPFGFIFTLTQFNLDELIWVAQFAVEQGAALLQVHPLEAVGRARSELPGAVPDGQELAYAVLAVARLEELVGDRITLQLDVAGRDSMAANPALFFANDDWPEGDAVPLATLLSPLIVEPDGLVVPVEYNFGRELALGNLRDARLPVLAADWRRHRLSRFRALCRSVQHSSTLAGGQPVINWYGQVARAATAAIVTPSAHPA